MKLLSIIMPVYNVEDYILECLESIIAQEGFEQLSELIIVNDCTQDNSIEIIKPIIAKYQNIQLINLSLNKGLSNARNVGIAKSTGKYIWFVDSDDTIHSNAYLILQQLLKNDIDILHFNHHRSDKVKPEPFPSATSVKVSGPDFAYNKTTPSCVPFYIWSHQLIANEKLYFLPNVYHEDSLYTPTALNCAKTITLTPEVLYFYRIRENSITSSSNYYQRAYSMTIILSQFMNQLSNSKITSIQRKVVHKHIGLTIGAIFYYWRRSSRSDRTKIGLELRTVNPPVGKIKIKYQLVALYIMWLK